MPIAIKKTSKSCKIKQSVESAIESLTVIIVKWQWTVAKKIKNYSKKQ